MSDYGDKKARQALEHAQLIERTRKQARIVVHDDPPAKQFALRKKNEQTLHGWLKYYIPDVFSDEFSPDHLRVLSKVEKAVADGGLFAQAMPRGHGKSTICRGAALYALLTGKRKYVISIAATADLAHEMLEFVRKQLSENELLKSHYPEVCHYIAAVDGKALKAKYQLRKDGKPSGIEWGTDRLRFPSGISKSGKSDYPSSGAIIEVNGLTGSVRGRSKDSNGKVIRPDLCIIDDPQTRESAESPSQCANRERIITGDIMGLAGPRKKIACVMPCTIIRKGDLADRFLDRSVHPEWQGETCRLVYEWPKSQETLWKRYGELYRDGIADGDGTGAAFAFYQENRAAMDEGAIVSWDQRIRDGEVSAIHTAQNMLLEMGPQFWAEMQNDPRAADTSVYTIGPDAVLAHAAGPARFVLPDKAQLLVGHCDINRVGLHWAISAFDQTMTPHVCAYGRWPNSGDLWEKNATEQARRQSIFRGLASLCDTINTAAFTRGGQRATVDLFLIDRGYEPDTVQRFALSARYSFRVVPAWGFAAHKYRPDRSSIIGRPFEQAHLRSSQMGRFVAFNSDYWREVAQRAFLAMPGERGGVTLHSAPPDMPRYHVRFAEHLCSQQLANKYQTDGGTRWEWTRPVGLEDHWLDAYVGCWVAAAVNGLHSSGESVQTVQRRRAPRIRMVNV